MPVSANKCKPSKTSEDMVRDINQRIINRQRKAESSRNRPSLKSLTTTFFEGIKIS